MATVLISVVLVNVMAVAVWYHSERLSLRVHALATLLAVVLLAAGTLLSVYYGTVHA